MNTVLKTDLIGRSVVRTDGLKKGVVRTAFLGPHGVTYQVETEDGFLENTDMGRVSQWKLLNDKDAV